MAEPKFVIESGIQLLARLTKKPNVANFYPILFNSGPESGDLIEICYESDTSWLLVDIISEAILHNTGTKGIEVLLFNTDGNLNYEVLLKVLKRKIFKRLDQRGEDTKQEESIFQDSLSKLHILEIFDENQFLVTIHNLDNILIAYPNISLVFFNSLTAFYWSEQGFKIRKMDLHLKNLIQIIKKFIREYKMTCLYTRPQSFLSSNDFDGQGFSHIAHPQIILSYQNDEKDYYKVNVKTMDKEFVRYFNIRDGTIKWDID